MKHLELNGVSYGWPNQPVVVVCIDGGDPAYFERGIKDGIIPNIEKFMKEGFAGIANGTVPSFTCPNNMSLITGAPASVHGISGNYYLNDKIVLRTFYRYYYDNWNINSHTVSFEPSYKLTEFSSIAIPYRFYHQSQAKYFDAKNQHQLTNEYYTSDYDLSKFSSNMIGLDYHIVDSNKGIFNIKRIHSLDLRYGYYTRNDGLASHIITLALQFK